MTPTSRTPRARRLLVLSCLAALISLALAASCGGDAEGEVPPIVALPDELVILAPERPLADMEVVEDYSEEVANRFIELADKLRRRDFRGADDWIAADFAGHSFDGLESGEETELPLDTRRTDFEVASAQIVGRADFLGAFAAWLGPWERVETVQWKVKGAEFETGLPLWGRVRFRITLLGSGAKGDPRSVVGWGHARCERREGRWLLTAFALDSLRHERRPAPLFTDVAAAVGLAHSGIRFGRPGNQSFAWNGAAGGDVDGDGLWDLFVPSRPRNFLYLGRTDDEGQAFFAEEAAERGLREPAGGTGAVFFDFDNDGDQDLALADVGWEGGGNRLRLYANQGPDKLGHFAEVGSELGFDALCDAYSLTVLDADGDGWLDVFVCNYGRVAAEPNNSWIQATNGSPNALYRNLAGQGFREEAARRGLVDTSWTYAAAAADHDLDGDQDLYVANDYGRNSLWLNDGTGHFEDAAEALGITDLGNGMGAAWGDLDNDGALDLYVSNMSSTAGNRILARLAKKDGTWGELSKLAAGNTVFLATAGNGGGFHRLLGERGGIGANWAWSPTLIDLDLDGRLDVYCPNGFVTGDTPADT